MTTQKIVGTLERINVNNKDGVVIMKLLDNPTFFKMKNKATTDYSHVEKTSALALAERGDQIEASCWVSTYVSESFYELVHFKNITMGLETDNRSDCL